MPRNFQKAVSDFEQKTEKEVSIIIDELRDKFKEGYVKQQRNAKLEMVYLPNVSPERRVKYILIAMEPSFSRWAKSESDAEEKVKGGFRNFLLSVEDMILHFCAGKYLEGAYHITDISKIAIRAEGAKKIRKDAWLKQKNLLIEELMLFGIDNFRIIPVGISVVGPWVEKNLKVNPSLKNTLFCKPILHYSPRASRYRKDAAIANPIGFKRFFKNWDPDEFISHANKCRRKMKNVESMGIYLRDIPSDCLSETYLNLAFTYKIAFEKIKE